MTKNKRIVWDVVGFVWCLFFIVGPTFFSEEYISIAVKNGNLNFFGWCVILLSVLMTWLVMWHMFKEQSHWRTSISALLASILAVCIGLCVSASLESELFLKATERVGLGTFGLSIMMVLLGSFILLLLFVGVVIKILRIFKNHMNKQRDL